jgi:hypothetical protein
MSDEAALQPSMILYQTEDGRTCIQCRLVNETLWLTQALLAESFQKDGRTINEHLANIYDEGELVRNATIRSFRIVRREGAREVACEIEHYSLPARWRHDYNHRRPHSSLEYATPAAFAAQCNKDNGTEASGALPPNPRLLPLLGNSHDNNVQSEYIGQTLITVGT